jgi:cell cycle checkpoint control protein RAD9A
MREVLKQPLHTSIAIDTLEFSDFTVEERLHIVVSVKDFKAIIAHAGTTPTVVSAHYSIPGRPFQLAYTDEGMSCEFILMTMGDSRTGSVTPAPGAIRSNSTRPQPKQSLEAVGSRGGSMAPPPRSAAPSVARDTSRAKATRPSPPPPQASFHSDSLFIPDGDDDRQWDPVNYEDDDGDMPGWNASVDHVGP